MGPRQLAEGIEIRPATEDEIEELLPLMRAYCDFYEVSPTDEGVTTMARTLITEPSQGTVFIARQDGRAIGFATLDWKWSMLKGARIGYLEDLFVDPAARGGGTADALIQSMRRPVPRARHAGDGVAYGAGQPPGAEGLQPHQRGIGHVRGVRPRAMTDDLRSTVGAVWLNHVRRGHGDPLILLHSLGGSLAQWSPVMDRLAAEREVIAVDMPGFGESAELPEGVSPRAANLATAVLDFYDALGIDGKPAVAGISLGAWVAIECARQGAASAAVALCPAGFWKRSPGNADRVVARRRRRRRLARPLLRPIMATARGRRRALGRFVHRPERLRPGEAEAIARAYVTAPAYEEASALMRAGRIEELKSIKVPITLAWAEHDTLVRDRPLPSKLLPKRVEQVELPGCGHVPTWDDPDLVSRVVLAGARRKR